MRTRPKVVWLAPGTARFDAVPLLLSALGALAACKSVEPTPADDTATCQCDEASAPAPDAALPIDAGAAGTDGGLLQALDAATAPDQASPQGPNADALPCAVSAVLREHCSMCHGAEPAFGAPMSLLTWEDLHAASRRSPDRSVGELLLERVQSSASPMPPAPQARLSAAELDTLAHWFAAGAPKQACQSDVVAGVTDAGVVPVRSVPRPADCEATYELRAHGGDTDQDPTKFRVSSMPAREGNQYHCFYFKPPYADGSGLLWFETLLDDTASLHHWILYATDNAKQAPGSSGPCNGAGVDTYFVAGWAPGATNTALPDDVSLALPSGPNAGLILEVHYYNTSGMPRFDATGLRFCTARQSARAHTAGVHFLGSEGICIPPASHGFEVKSVCAPRSDLGEIHITGVWPHMHKRARRQRLVIARRGGSSEVLHDQPFDFNTQLFYAKPDVVLGPGDRIETTCFYDNEGNQQVSYGERTEDEMCYAFVTAWPAGALSSTSLLGGSVLQVNRCGGDLSILDSCNGIDDSPAVVIHPP